jgi:EAL domain-containing protein (putative c-di-GMP-specific phosphodiesterase class I)
MAMYQAKAEGKNRLAFFDPYMQEAAIAYATLENELRVAFHENQFELFFQIQVNVTGKATGAEALLRWRHPTKGWVHPGDFIPLAEETRLILPIGNWVLQAACQQIAAWAARPETAHLTLAVNVSALQMSEPDFVNRVLVALDQSGANPSRLKLELTETLLASDIETVIAKMTALREKGVSFALDDFGTGYSSLAYLKRMPIEQLKIDQSFIRDLHFDHSDKLIAKSIIALAESMELAVIAEGVETEEHRNILIDEGCLAYQGFLYGRPMPSREFENALLTK